MPNNVWKTFPLTCAEVPVLLKQRRYYTDAYAMYAACMTFYEIYTVKLLLLIGEENRNFSCQFPQQRFQDLRRFC